MTSNYAFSSAPQAVRTRGRAKYRAPFQEENFAPVSSNIMYDKRVVRGNTYAAQVLPANAQEEAERLEAGRNSAMNKRQMMDQRLMEQRVKPSTPEPVDGRRHMDVQTENYLEELTDKMPEVDEGTQTEAFMDRPPLPLFVPTKTGVDKDTQIEPGDGLFSFDLEVEPILEVLVGKTLEQSMMEVLEEEELYAIRAHQDEFEQMRNAELAEVQRLEAEARRRFDEKERRLEQERTRMAQEKDLKEKVSARSFAKDYLTDLHTGVFDVLLGEGFFYDPLTKEVEKAFMPWLFNACTGSMTDHPALNTPTVASSTARQITEDLLMTVLSKTLGTIQAASKARSVALVNPLEVAAVEFAALEKQKEEERILAEAAAAEAAEKAAEAEAEAEA